MKKNISIVVALFLIIQLFASAVHAGSSTGSGGGGGSSSLGPNYQDSVTFTQNGQTIEERFGVWNGAPFQVDTCQAGCGSSGSSGGSGGPLTPPPPPPSPPPVACKITVDKPVIGLGTSNISISWLPSPTTNVSLQRVETIPVVAQIHNTTQQASVILAGGGGSQTPAPNTTPPKVTTTTLIAPPSSASSFVDTVNETSPGTISYNITFSSTGVLALQHSKKIPTISQTAGIILAGGGGSPAPPPPPPPTSYGCTVTVKIVTTLTECNDGIDNADPEDTLIDQQDPACHTDGNAANALSYDPLRTTETNPAVDVIPHITAPLKVNAQTPITVTASEENIGTLAATTNTLVSGWRSLVPGGTPSCGVGGSLCFTANGNSYITVSSFPRAYAPQQTSTDTPYTFTPVTQGMYEVCAVADYTNVIAEGVAGEANNTACQPIQVLAVGAVVAPPTATSPLALVTAPNRVRSGGVANLVWDTGSRTQCTITGTNGQIIYLAGTVGMSTATTTPITAETKYTLSCADDNTSTSVLVKLLPQYREF